MVQTLIHDDEPTQQWDRTESYRYTRAALAQQSVRARAGKSAAPLRWGFVLSLLAGVVSGAAIPMVVQLSLPALMGR